MPVENILKMNENELIVRYAATKKEKYFSALVSLYDKKLFNYIVRRIGHFESAKDVYQNVWLKIAANADKYKDEKRFSNYLFFIATNACFDHLRKLKKDNENIYNQIVTEDGNSRDIIDNLRSDTPDPETENIDIENRERLKKVIDLLPDEQKDVVLLRSNGLTFREISEMKDVSLNSILSRYRYGVDKIKKALK